MNTILVSILNAAGSLLAILPMTVENARKLHDILNGSGEFTAQLAIYEDGGLQTIEATDARIDAWLAAHPEA